MERIPPEGDDYWLLFQPLVKVIWDSSSQSLHAKSSSTPTGSNCFDNCYCVTWCMLKCNILRPISHRSGEIVCTQCAAWCICRQTWGSLCKWGWTSAYRFSNFSFPFFRSMDWLIQHKTHKTQQKVEIKGKSLWKPLRKCQVRRTTNITLTSSLLSLLRLPGLHLLWMFIETDSHILSTLHAVGSFASLHVSYPYTGQHSSRLFTFTSTHELLQEARNGKECRSH